MRGTITEGLDAVQVLVAAFCIFFLFLIYWLRREDKREGYPMKDVSPVGVAIEGFPDVPPPKTYRRMKGDTVQMPHDYGSSKVYAERLLRFEGAPLVPIGNPLLAEVGPGAYPLREDEPLLSMGKPQVVPLRADHLWSVAEGETDPRGMPVHDSRHVLVGTVAELWVDRSVKILRYLEVILATPDDRQLLGAPEPRRLLLPIYFADIRHRRGFIRVTALLAHQFADVPGLARMDQITAREEDRLNAYYASGQMFSRGQYGGLPVSPSAPWLKS